MHLARSVCGLAVAVCLAACAGNPAGPPPASSNTHDLQAIERAEAMLKRAQEADAPELAPKPFREARRRLTMARALLHRSGAEGARSGAQTHAKRLAQEAWLDARLALSRAEAAIAERRLRNAQQALQQETSP